MTDKPKSNWGGKRANQTGRPKIKDKRIHLNCRVHPKTMAKLKSKATKEDKSVGQVIDDLSK